MLRRGMKGFLLMFVISVMISCVFTVEVSSKQDEQENISNNKVVKAKANSNISVIGSESLKMNISFKGENGNNKDKTKIEIILDDDDVRTLDFQIIGKNNKIVKSNPKNPEEGIYFYYNVKKNVDIMYEVSEEALKDTIIIHDAIAEYKFEYLISIDEDTELVLRDNQIDITDTINEQVIGNITSPFAYDSGNEPLETFNCEYSLSEYGQNIYKLSVSLNDDEFLENALFPIYIDPTVELSQAGGESRYYNDSDDLSYIKVADDEKGTKHEYDGVIGMDVSEYSNRFVEEAILSLYVNVAYMNSDAEVSDCIIEVRPITEPWVDGTSSIPDTGSLIGTIDYYNKSESWVTLDIKDYLNEIFENEIPFYGFVLQNKEVSTDDSVYAYISVDESLGTAPYIDITVNATPRAHYESAILSPTKVGVTFKPIEHESDNRLKVGDYETSTKTEYYCAFDIDINDARNKIIKSAELNFTIEDYRKYGTATSSDCVFYIQPITSNWNAGSNRPSFSSEIIATYNYAGADNRYVTIDVTDWLIQTIESGTPFYGFMLVPKEVSTGEKAYTWLYEPGTEQEPNIEIRYVVPEIITVYPNDNSQIITDNYVPNVDVRLGASDDVVCTVKIDGNLIESKSVSLVSEEVTNVQFNTLSRVALNNGTHTIEYSIIAENGDIGSDSVQVNVNYINAKPVIDATIYDTTVVYMDATTMIYPSLSIHDIDNNTLSCSYNIDEGALKSGVKPVTSTLNSKQVALPGVNISSLSEGTHTIKFFINDGNTQTTVTKSFIRNKKPVITNINEEIGVDYFKVTSSFSDGIGFMSNPYVVKFDGVFNGWNNSRVFTATGLEPNSRHTYYSAARDSYDERILSQYDKVIYTKAEVPDITVNNIGEMKLQLQIHDNNPINTEYVIMCNGLYINSQGEATNLKTVFTLPEKSLVITGLSGNQIYSIKVQAVNGDSVGTSYTPTIDILLEYDKSISFSGVKNSTYKVACVGTEVEDINDYEFVIRYDKTRLKAVDLCYQTSDRETSVGNIEYTGIEITAFTEGEIRIRYKKDVAGTNVWAGLLNIIEFEALTDGSQTVQIGMETIN